MTGISFFPAHPGGVRATPATVAENPKARDVARQFEGVFLMQVLESMSSGQEADSLFGGGAGDKIYRSMFNEETANAIARRGGVGIADAVYRNMLQLQETRR